MVVKSQLRLIKSLHQKKNRKAHGLFIIEGEKGILEALKSGLIPYFLCSTHKATKPKFKCTQITHLELSQMSALKNPNGFLGVFKIPQYTVLDPSSWVLVLDGVQDPGNLGTIIRLCDWFGVHQILCSPNTVDCFNPKTVQATMGSIARVKVVYDNLTPILGQTKAPVFGTFMAGTPVRAVSFKTPGYIVLGNEGNGISKEVSGLISEKITITSHAQNQAESLNVASAAAIVLHELRR